MEVRFPPIQPPAAGLAGLHGIAWLVCANAVGVLLAIMLMWPELNGPLAPFSYGRWIPLHHNFQLYGWISFPLIGMLFHFFKLNEQRKTTRAVLTLWTVSLTVGGLSWLSGESSGKLFLEWRGFARILFCAALGFLWFELTRSLITRRRNFNTRGILIRGGLLLLLLPVPAVMYLAAGGDVYPPINPSSGGATGSSLLGSTLGIIVLFLCLPPLINGAPRKGFHALIPHFSVLICHWLLFALLGGGDHDNHELAQILGLGSLLIWVPLLIHYYRRFDWPPAFRVWLTGFACWGGLLALSGWIAFLPGVLERWKFTNALVSHAHLAMAGMVTSFLMLLLPAIDKRLMVLTRTTPALLWQGACLIHVAALLILGSMESDETGALFSSAMLPQTFYGIRLVAGGAMFLVSCYWLVQVIRRRTETPSLVVS